MKRSIEIEDVKLTPRKKYPLHYHLMEVNMGTFGAEDKGYSSNMYISEIKGYVSITARGGKLHM